MRGTFAYFPIFLLSACGIAESSSSPVDSNPGPSGSRSFDVSGFDQVKLAGSDNVRVVAGSAFSVQATGPEKTLEKLEIAVRGSTLTVGRKSKSWSMGWSNNPSATVTITMPVIKGASLAGSGDFSPIKSVYFPAPSTAAFNVAKSAVASVNTACMGLNETETSAANGDNALVTRPTQALQCKPVNAKVSVVIEAASVSIIGSLSPQSIRLGWGGFFQSRFVPAE